MGFDRETEVGLHINKIGTSKGVVIPKQWREELDLDTGDVVDAEFDRDRQTITYHL